MSQTKPSLLKIYWILMKPRVVFLLQVTALCGIFTYDFKEGYDSGRTYIDSFTTSLIVLIGGTMASGGSMAVNMWYERDIDPLMERTENRPIQAGFISPNHALLFGISISLIGIILVSLLTNLNAGIITALSALFYTVIYTMVLKRRTPQNIVIGGAAGALPPLIGWVSVSGGINSFPVILFFLIFIWTPPHFWALSLFSENDYGKVGLPMLPNVLGKKTTIKSIIKYSYLLYLVSLLPFFLDYSGILYLVISVILNTLFLYMAYCIKPNDIKSSKKLFKYSIFYLFMIFIALIVDSFLTFYW